MEEYLKQLLDHVSNHHSAYDGWTNREIAKAWIKSSPIKAENLSELSVCFVVVDDDGRIESIHRTKEGADKEIRDWKRFRPSKDVSIQERELN